MSGKKVYSTHPGDTGNWLDGRMVGSQHGVTGAALAAYRGVPHSAITAAVMQQLTLDEAADIGMRDYFKGPRFDLLEWGPATASLVDWGWMSGPGTPIKHIQRIIGATADGALGPQTAAKYKAWVDRVGWAAATDAVRNDKIAFFESLDRPEFIDGWRNRANYYGSNTSWFKAF